ncbi:MAG: hypothetical protein HDP34_04835 [Clostridia bacterium]|nr:hypothetical protein [Clostridia bacterium]
MSGYTKNIAVIKGLKDGFSADGGPLTGLVKAEKYGANLKVEVTYINFAPLIQGRYVTAISDGVNTEIVEGERFEGTSKLNTGEGFAALVCYINGQVSPIASAISGGFADAALNIKQAVERYENLKPADGDKTAATEEKYEDEAIAEVNYYEFAEADKGGGAVRKDKAQKEDGLKTDQNETAFSAFKKGQSGVNYNGLSTGGNFYERMKDEIENLFKTYPCEKELENVVMGSRWVRINYGDNKFYVFGIISDEGKPRYICYGVPTEQSYAPPESMQGLASFIPCPAEERQRGYWVMYQDAATGASLKIDVK